MSRVEFFDYYKEVTVPANGEITFDFLSDNSVNRYVPFKNLFIFNANTTDLKVYVNRREYPRHLVKSGIIQAEDIDVKHLKFVNDSASNVDIILTCNNDITELEALKKMSG